ncbi:MAG: hypothetical protein HY899_01525 [Deltaproteobacteria bacterium]|nr:hypothetical protein [Deltaproteobacteria bacterium]
MNRTEFEALRDLPGKTIDGDIRLSRREALRPVREASDISIANEHGVDLRMGVRWNPETGKKTVNVYVPGLGPICRIDVDGPMHRDAGRSHKHSLHTERCPDRNLDQDVAARPDLSGRDLETVLRQFCREAAITFGGVFDPGL